MSLRHLYLDLREMGVYPDISKNDDKNEIVITSPGTYHYSKYYGPCVKYHEDDCSHYVIFHDVSGRRHRDKFPAYYEFWEGIEFAISVINNFMLKDMVCPCDYVMWYKHGILHNDNGPAKITNVVPHAVNDYGTWEWYIDGVNVNEHEGKNVVDDILNSKIDSLENVELFHPKKYVKFTFNGKVYVYEMGKRYIPDNYEVVFDEKKVSIRHRGSTKYIHYMMNSMTYVYV